jgi:hypothetical protein
MLRRLLVSAAALAVAASVFVTVEPARSLPRGAECNVSGSATISPGLGTKAVTQSVRLSNVQLTGCRAGNSGSPGVPQTTTASVSTSPNPVTGKGSCATSSIKNVTATIFWSTGTTTKALFSTQSLTGETAVTGNIVSSTDPNLRAGDLLAGNVVFTPTTTKQNCAKVPVTAVNFTGLIAAGNPKK